jgi:glyoxylase-like metal-dependent hydrolase (beta-lactamase superfamily II)
VIHCLPIPTPFMVGRVNVYLIEDDPLTLVDTGPNSGKALDELERALADHGRQVEDLELIVITHQHLDHQGLAQILARRSGADVAALDRLVPLLERFAEANEADDAFAEALMLRHGLSPDVAVALRSVSRAFRAWGSSVEVNRTLTDGGVLELRDRRLQVFHRPGHSPTDTIFWDERRQALVTYMDSLRKTRELPAKLVLPGHGDPIEDHAALIDERFRVHERRAAKILGLLAEQPRTAHDVAQALWGNIAVTQAFLTLSEVLGHVDLLLNRGQVREIDRDGVSVFEAVRAM